VDTIDDIEDEPDLLSQDGESRKKLLKAVREFRVYKNFAAISKRTKTLFRTMGIVTGMEKRFQRRFAPSFKGSLHSLVSWALFAGICKSP
jgi:hypothetical protein